MNDGCVVFTISPRVAPALAEISGAIVGDPAALVGTARSRSQSATAATGRGMAGAPGALLPEPPLLRRERIRPGVDRRRGHGLQPAGPGARGTPWPPGGGRTRRRQGRHLHLQLPRPPPVRPVNGTVAQPYRFVGNAAEGVLVQHSAETSLAYKGLDGVPLWLLFGVAMVAFIVFGVVQARRKK